MPKNRYVVPAILALLVAVHFAVLAMRCPPALTSPDANGYYAQAALLAERGSVELEPRSPLSYIGMHFLETEDGRFFSRYSPGVAVLLYLPYRLLGPAAAALVTPLLASLTLVCVYLLARRVCSSRTALLGAALYALHPLANEHALNWGAHTQTTFFLVAGLGLLTVWERRPRWQAALAAGLVLGVVPALRYAEAVAGLGAGVFLLLRSWREPRLRWHPLVALAGALVPVGALLLHNARVFGSPFTTGYALTGEQQAGTGFSLAFFAEHWSGYLESLLGIGAGLLFPLAVAGGVALFVRRDTRAFAVLLGLVIVPITCVYMAYYWGGQGDMGLRFLLPTLPLYLVPALYLARQAGRRGALRAGFVSVVLLQAIWWGVSSLRRVGQAGQELQRQSTIAALLAERVELGSIVVGERGVLDSLQYLQRYELVDGSLFGGRGAFGARGPGPGGDFGPGPDGLPFEGFGGFGPDAGPRFARAGEEGTNGSQNRAEPMQRDKARKLRARYDVRDRQLRQQRLHEDLAALAGDKTIVWIGREGAAQPFARGLPEGRRLELLAKLEGPRGGPGGGGQPGAGMRRPVPSDRNRPGRSQDPRAAPPMICVYRVAR